MKNDYLINLACYINTEQKRDWAIELLTYFKKENVDVCTSLHSSLYLSDIAEFSRFVYFDSDNTMIEESDFIINSDLMDQDRNKYGIAQNYIYNDRIYVYNNFLQSKHSKAALSILKNGLSVAFHQGYKWVVYMEYDVISPKKGYKKLIEEKIEKLEKENKDAFFYRVDKQHLGGLFGTLIIMKSDILIRSELINRDWYSSPRNWIKHWGCSFFEKVVEAILVSENKFQCIEENIDEVCIEDWGVVRNDNFNKSAYADDLNKNIVGHRYEKTVKAHLYPYRINEQNEYHLYLYATNYTEISTEFFDVNVYIDEISVFNIKQFVLNPNCWWMEIVDICTAKPESKIKLTGHTKCLEKINYFEEYFIYKNIQQMHDNLLNLFISR